jgi:hypothetical protein
MQAVNRTVIRISEAYSKTPGPRYIIEGPFSGEKLRQEILLSRIVSAIEGNGKILIDLDGTAGYGTSFLEEAFGGLLRVNNIPYEQLEKTLEFKSDEEPYLIQDVWEYMKDAHDKKQI